MSPLSIENSPIRGLRKITLDLRKDERGWFEEFWQAEKFRSLELAFFEPRQSNISFNLDAGVTRGLHAEPWSKLVTVASGRVFSAWVDLRVGAHYGHVHFDVIEPGTAYFVPKGVANSYQALENGTAYAYLVDGLWTEGLLYPALNAFDPELAIPWPIGSEGASMSPKDLANPSLAELHVGQKPIVIFGGGQLSKALQERFPSGSVFTREDFDFSEVDQDFLYAQVPFNSVVINAAAFTKVDKAETREGFELAMKANYLFPKKLAEVCLRRSATLIHVSSDYVFSGDDPVSEYSEVDQPNPRSKYGVSKLLGDLAVSRSPHVYIVRTSWVFGNGDNFFRTIRRLSANLSETNVVSDQFGRPTSARELARFIQFVIEDAPDFGIYNLTCSGPRTSWFELAQITVRQQGLSESVIKPISTADYEQGKNMAPRPKNSCLDLRKTRSVGFEPKDWRMELNQFLESWN